MVRRSSRFVLLCIICLILLGVPARKLHAQTNAPILVHWYTGFATGSLGEQITVQQAVVDQFNATHMDIQIELDLIKNASHGFEVLEWFVGAGFPPDLVGPIPRGDAEVFHTQWLDLDPFVTAHHVDLSHFPPAMLNLYRKPEGLVGIPFGTIPTMLYYNVDLFDEAGLAYPPTRFGEKYLLDGKPVDWNFQTVAEISRRLTVDGKGNDATSPAFDQHNIAQWGYAYDWGSTVYDFLNTGNQPLVDSSGKVQIPLVWRDEAHWLWDGIWKDHSSPDSAYLGSNFLKPNPMSSGRVAMYRDQSLMLCCLSDLKGKWDVGVIPNPDLIPMETTSFRIVKDTKYPEAVFTVLQYLTDTAKLDLLDTYKTYPARTDLEAPFISRMSAQYPTVTHWESGTTANQPTYFVPNVSGVHLDLLYKMLYLESSKDVSADQTLGEVQALLQTNIDAPH